MTTAALLVAAPPPVDRVDGVAAPVFLRHVHLLRAVAILLVVGAHCWPDFAWTPSQQRYVLLVFDNVTVVFMFISGLLFQHLAGRFRYPRYLKHRFSIVMLPYAIVSIPAILMVVFFQHRGDIWPWVYAMPVWKQVAFFLFTGKHLAPLWFMPMMALFILAAPLFVAIDRRNAYPWLVPATLALAILLGRDSVHGVGNVFGKALFMLPAYLAGMAFGRHRDAAEAWCARHAAVLAGALAAVSAVIFADTLPTLDLTIVQKLLVAGLLLVTLKRIDLGPRADAMLGRLADVSFAVYFVHGYVIATFRILYERIVQHRSGGAPPFGPSVIGLVVHIALVAAMSVAIVSVVQAVLGRRSRMVIGA